MPFVHIPQYKEKEFVEQSVVWRCSVEGFLWIIRRIDAVGALAFPKWNKPPALAQDMSVGERKSRISRWNIREKKYGHGKSITTEVKKISW